MHCIRGAIEEVGYAIHSHARVLKHAIMTSLSDIHNLIAQGCSGTAVARQLYVRIAKHSA